MLDEQKQRLIGVETLQKMGLRWRGIRPCGDRKGKTLPRQLYRTMQSFLRDQAEMKHGLEHMSQPRPRSKSWSLAVETFSDDRCRVSGGGRDTTRRGICPALAGYDNESPYQNCEGSVGVYCVTLVLMHAERSKAEDR